MRHPWFNLRMILVSLVLVGVYIPVMWITVDLGVPPEFVVGGVLFILWIQYLVGIRRALKSVNVTRVNTGHPLYARTERLADRLNVPMPNLYVGEFGSPNAFATGRKGNGHIVLDRSLFNFMTDDEIDAIVAHELSHLRSRDTIPMIIGEGSAGLAFMAASAIESLFIPNTHHHREPCPVNSPIGTFAHSCVMCLVFAISRQREYIADADSVEALGSPRPLQSALLKLDYIFSGSEVQDPPEAVEALCIASNWSLTRFMASHPPLDDRVETLNTLAIEED